MKISVIFWYVDASQQKKCYKKTIFGFRPFLAVFNQKQPKKEKKKLAKSKPFDEIWYVDASQQKNATKKHFLDFALFWSFFNQKIPKIDQNRRKFSKSKPFDEIF